MCIAVAVAVAVAVVVVRKQWKFVGSGGVSGGKTKEMWLSFWWWWWWGENNTNLAEWWWQWRETKIKMWQWKRYIASLFTEMC